MIIGEGTNEIQRLIITRSLLDRYGERFGALTSREGEPEERRQVVLAVRQLVDKDVMPAAQDDERAGHYPAALVARVADLGVLGCLTSPGLGGLGLDLATYAMVLEELARGWSTVAGIVAAQATAAHIIECFGARVAERVGDRFEPGTARQRSLAAMTRGERRGAVALGPGISARADGDGWALAGAAALVDQAEQSDVLVVLARMPDGEPGGFQVERNAPHLTVGAAPATLGARGLGAADVVLDGVRVGATARLGDGAARAAEVLARLALAATAVGLAQAAFEAALRYSQQRSTFGQPICQHQAVQLKLADMATRITAARLLTDRAAERLDRRRGRRHAACGWRRSRPREMAADVTLESMRIHGGYGYTSEFPVERLYRDAARLVVAPRTTTRSGDSSPGARSSARRPGCRHELRPLLRGVLGGPAIQALAGAHDRRGGLHLVRAPHDEPAPAAFGRALRRDIHPAQAARGAGPPRLQRGHRHDGGRRLRSRHRQPRGRPPRARETHIHRRYALCAEPRCSRCGSPSAATAGS